MAKVQEEHKRDPNGGGSIFQEKNGTFRLYYRDPATGKRHAKVLTLPDNKGREVPVTNKEDARKAAKKLREKLADIHALTDTKKIVDKKMEIQKKMAGLLYTPNDIWQKYIDKPKSGDSTSDARLRDIKRVIDRLVAWCKVQNPPVGYTYDITGNTLSKFLNDVYGDLSGRSYTEAKTILKQVFKIIYDDLGMDADPSKDLKGKTLDSKHRKPFDEKQEQAILRGFDTGFFYETEVVRLTTGRKPERVKKTLEYKPEYPRQFRLLVLMMMYTGCRCGDACLMKWDAVDFSENTITYAPHKTQKSSGIDVSLPLHDDLRAGLLEALEWKRDGHILPDVASRYTSNPTGIYQTIQKLISCATGLEVTARDGEGRGAAQYGAHSFRHSFVSFCGSKGIPLDIVKKIVGHTDEKMTERYFKANKEALQTAIAALPSVRSDVPQQPKDITPDVLRMQIATFVNKAGLDDLRVIWHFIEKMQKSRQKQIGE